MRVHTARIQMGLGLAAMITAITATLHCSRRTVPEGQTVPATSTAPAVPTGNTAGSSTVRPSEAAPSPASSPAPSAQQVQAEVVAHGPRAELTSEHYVLTAALTPPASVPGTTSLMVEVRGANGYHVNELYPVGLSLQGSSMNVPAQLRRADATEVSQQRAAFSVPVQVTSAGAVLRGTARFAVCSEQNCIPYERAFAVNLP